MLEAEHSEHRIGHLKIQIDHLKLRMVDRKGGIDAVLAHFGRIDLGPDDVSRCFTIAYGRAPRKKRAVHRDSARFLSFSQ